GYAAVNVAQNVVTCPKIRTQGKRRLCSAPALVPKLTNDKLRKLCQDQNWLNLVVRQMVNVQHSIFALRNIASGTIVVNQNKNFMKKVHLDRRIASLVNEEEKARKAE
uniref:Uncharacterized protein n=1 Tax=Romanomermis culicivorax TaxID=13658 RepID=A0A915JCT3_ROMCU